MKERRRAREKTPLRSLSEFDLLTLSLCLIEPRNPYPTPERTIVFVEFFAELWLASQSQSLFSADPVRLFIFSFPTDLFSQLRLMTRRLLLFSVTGGHNMPEGTDEEYTFHAIFWEWWKETFPDASHSYYPV